MKKRHPANRATAEAVIFTPVARAQGKRHPGYWASNDCALILRNPQVRSHPKLPVRPGAALVYKSFPQMLLLVWLDLAFTFKHSRRTSSSSSKYQSSTVKRKAMMPQCHSSRVRFVSESLSPDSCSTRSDLYPGRKLLALQRMLTNALW